MAVRERNVIATAFHPELAGETRFHRLVATMAAEHDDPGEGSGRRPHPHATRRAGRPTDDRAAGAPRRAGKVRAARLTDLAALGELSRLCQSDGADTRSLGLPVSGPPIGVFSLFRLPLGAFRPHDLLYVYEEDGRLAGLVRVERESVRDEWTIVELDAVGMADAGDIRYRLVQQLLRDGAKRGAARFHVACADARRQRRAVDAGRVRALRRGAGPVPAPVAGPSRAVAETAAPGCGIRPADAARCAAAVAGCTRRRRPRRSPASRRSASPTGSARARHWRVPRSSLTPILRFADVEGFVQAAPGGGRDGTELERLPPGRRRQGGSAALPQGHRPPRGRRRRRSSTSVSGVIADAHRQGRRPAPRPRGASRPSGPTNHRSTDAWRRRASNSIASVTLLMKETLVRVAEPALVPAGVR